MRSTPIDDMIEFALEELLAGDSARRRSLVRQLCMRWPDEPALAASFAVTSAASMVEDNFTGGADPGQIGRQAYRLAALLAADIYAVESMGHVPARARDLLHFWRRVDSYFLDL